MVNRDRDSRTNVDRRTFLTVAGASGVTALAGCSGEGSSDATATDTATPTDTPTATDTPTPTETETETPTETEVDVATATPVERGDGPLARPPEPTGEDVPRPTGEPGNLRVLDWAGFESAVTYSFDDSQPSHVEHYDALASTGVNMTFYLSKNVGFENFTAEWRTVAADGHEIGNHTVSHPHNDLSDPAFGEALDSMDAEVSRCSEYITGELGQEGVWTMASPFGESGWTQAARSNGLFLNRGVGGGAVAPGPGADPYNLPCYMAEEGDTADTFNGLVDDARSNGEWLVFLFHSITPTDQEWFAPVHVDEITGSVEHAKSYDDVWIDTVANVGAYWRGQQIFESVSPEESDDGTVWEWELPDTFPEGQHLRVTVDGGVLEQGGETLDWHTKGYYEVSLDEGSLTLYH